MLEPKDIFNETLVANVHPNDWVNPEPAPIYHLVVIGAGTAGLVIAAGAAGLGAKVALIEKHLMGGDCLNFGCVPSKSLIKSARMIADICASQNLGVQLINPPTVDFTAVMARMRRIRAEISSHDSAQRFQQLGVDVFLGSGRFIDHQTIGVGDQKLHFKKAAIATGTRPTQLDIPGLETAGYLTNETIFSLTKQPQRLAVIGGGPIGCELAQVFRRFGSQVILFHKNSHLLDREDPDAVEVLQQVFIREGIQLILQSQITLVENNQQEKIIYYQANGKAETVTVDEILISVGRTPNVENLNLDAVGVRSDQKKGIIVNDYLQTDNPRIYAAGDICMDWKFTHAADAAARIVIKNSLFSIGGFGKQRLSALKMSWCTYTTPEIAHVGINESDANKQGIELDTFVIPFTQVDRAIADGETEGFVKIHVQKNTDKILGATIVAPHAGEMISEITLAIASQIGLKTLATVIHPYPTQTEAIKKVAEQYNRTRLTPIIKQLFRWWLLILPITYYLYLPGLLNSMVEVTFLS